MSEAPRSGTENVPERIDLYLSGGGYRAALGALGVLFFLVYEGRWSAVRRIVSVSGGGIVNARIALTRPDESAVASELSKLFDYLTSLAKSRLLLARAIGPIVVAGAALTYGAYALADQLLVTILVGIIALAVGFHFIVRYWLHILYRGMLGKAYLDDLGGTDWKIEHVFVASDLSEHGSVFFITNPIQPQVCSLRRGFLDGRDVLIEKALRASTALPPALPATRLRLRSNPAKRPSPLIDREYLWDSKSSGQTVTAWLVDGGVTGNLGIQFDSALSPDNIALLERSMASTLAGTPVRQTKYMCPRHPHQIIWDCYACNRETIVVDASGLSPRRSRALSGFLLGLPALGQAVLTIRSLQVMYESSLTDDQANAGDTLIGVVRTEQMARRFALKNRPLSNSTESTDRQEAAGEFLDLYDTLTDPDLRELLISKLSRACLLAREAASQVKTGLFAIRPHLAARVVASGYLNACLNTFGVGAFDHAQGGMERLIALLGDDTRLSEWWESVKKQITS